MGEISINKINFFNGLDWKMIFKDVAKFYIYLIIFAALAFLLMWVHSYLFFKPYKIDMADVLSDQPLPELPSANALLDSARILGGLTVFYMVFLICFGVFFSTPPKSFKHVSIVAILVFLIGNFTLQPDLEILYNFCMIAGFALFAWVSSLAWHEYKSKKNPIAPIKK